MATRYLVCCSVCLLMLLSACVSPTLPGLPRGSLSFNFDWRLRGDRALGPLQVFDNGRQTWLQFAPQQDLPAVFAYTNTGEIPLDIQSKGQFHIFDGAWDHLVFRGGQSVAQAFKRGLDPLPDLVVASSPGIASASIAGAFPVVLTPDTQADAPLGVEVSVLLPVYEVHREDNTLRQALSRWATDAGWVFEPEHWSVSIDYPISAAAQFDPDFSRSVRDLLASTEMAEQPLQPCFYSNRVLRVVTWSQACDHTTQPQGHHS